MDGPTLGQQRLEYKYWKWSVYLEAEVQCHIQAPHVHTQLKGIGRSDATEPAGEQICFDAPSFCRAVTSPVHLHGSQGREFLLDLA